MSLKEGTIPNYFLENAILPFDVIKQIIVKGMFLDLLAWRVTCSNYYKLIDEEIITSHPWELSVDDKWGLQTLILLKADYQRREQGIGVWNMDQKRLARKVFWNRSRQYGSLYLLRPEGTVYFLRPHKKRDGWITEIRERRVLDIVVRRDCTTYYSLGFDHRVYYDKQLLDITNPVIQISCHPLICGYCLALDVLGNLWLCMAREVIICSPYSAPKKVIFTKLFSGVAVDSTGSVWYVIRHNIYQCGLSPGKVIDAIYNGSEVYVVLSNGDLYRYRCCSQGSLQRTNIMGVEKIFLTYDDWGRPDLIYITTRTGKSFSLKENGNKTGFIQKSIPYNILHVDSTVLGDEIVVIPRT